MEILHTLGIEPKVILIQIIGFFLLFWVLKKFLFGKVGEFLRKRSEEIRLAYEKIEKDKKEMEELKIEYDKHLQRIDEERKDLIAQAIKEGQEQRKEIMEETRKEADKIIQKAKQEIELEKEKAVIGLREEIVNLTMIATEKVVGEIVDVRVHHNLISQFIDDLSQISEE